jgi:hypothetical protein
MYHLLGALEFVETRTKHKSLPGIAPGRLEESLFRRALRDVQLLSATRPRVRFDDESHEILHVQGGKDRPRLRFVKGVNANFY